MNKEDLVQGLTTRFLIARKSKIGMLGRMFALGDAFGVMYLAIINPKKVIVMRLNEKDVENAILGEILDMTEQQLEDYLK